LPAVDVISVSQPSYSVELLYNAKKKEKEKEKEREKEREKGVDELA